MPERIMTACLLALVMTIASGSVAMAHRLKVFATVVGSSIEGRAYFVGGGPAANVQASLRDAEERQLAQARTDAQGRFAFAAPVRAEFEVVVDARDGHVARFAIAASRLPASLPAPREADAPPAANLPDKDVAGPPASDEIAAVVARQIEPLAAQIDALESSLRLRDIVGGIGYILGVFGLLAFVQARRGRPRGDTP